MSDVVILCVDDEEVPRTLRALVLGKQGYVVLTAVSAAQALELLEQNHVDLVLTDQIMPEVAGTELAKRLRSTRPTLPIVIVSGVNEIPEDACFADRFISKVEGPEALFRCIAEVLAHYAGQLQTSPAAPVVTPGLDIQAPNKGLVHWPDTVSPYLRFAIP